MVTYRSCESLVVKSDDKLTLIKWFWCDLQSRCAAKSWSGNFSNSYAAILMLADAASEPRRWKTNGHARIIRSTTSRLAAIGFERNALHSDDAEVSEQAQGGHSNSS